MPDLNQTVIVNVKAAIKANGSPSFYRLGVEMAKVVRRPPGIGLDKYGPEVKPETCRRHVEDCLSGRKCFRLDYLQGLAWVLSVTVAELVSPKDLAKKAGKKA